jgi:hypothetical protein
MARHNKHLTPADYKRKGMTPPMEKAIVFAAMQAHAFGKEYGLIEPYLYRRCGLRVKSHGDLPPSDNQQGRQDNHLCPPIMLIDPVDMVGNTLHAGIQIFPHVMWYTVYNKCINVATTQADVKALDVIELPVREINVLFGKGKDPTKADLIALNGQKVHKLMEGLGVVLDAVLSPSDHGVQKPTRYWKRKTA